MISPSVYGVGGGMMREYVKNEVKEIPWKAFSTS